MAQRRMFSPDIVCSDAFFEMPTSSRELYFQLGMRADDDGFVNPRVVMRMTGASEDDLKVLTARRFIIPFETGVVVVKHWKINNLVRKDWYKATLYQEEKKRLKIKENGAYTELVNEMLTIRSRRLGKVRIGNTNTTRSQSSRGKKKAMNKYNENSSYEEPAIDLESGEKINSEVKSTVAASIKYLVNWAEERRGFKFVNVVKQYAAFKKARSAGLTPPVLQARWEEMELDKFWREKGFDWSNVVASFDKRP